MWQNDRIKSDAKTTAVLRALSHAPSSSFFGSYAEQNPAVFGKREVILSLYLAGEQYGQ